MKAKELIKILEKHPEAIVCISDFNNGKMSHNSIGIAKHYNTEYINDDGDKVEGEIISII